MLNKETNDEACDARGNLNAEPLDNAAADWRQLRWIILRRGTSYQIKVSALQSKKTLLVKLIVN